MKKFFKRFYVIFIFFLLYAPILVLVINSFNASRMRTTWGGFSFNWYLSLFQNEAIISAVKNSLLLTTSSAIIATLLGLLACIGMVVMSKRGQSVITGVTNIPLLNADIVTGIAIMLLFVRFTDLGFSSMLVGHVTLGIPYVILNILPRMKQLGASAYEAALDLGATPFQAFRYVVLPELRPAILTGFLLAFTISLDDFIVTYFTKGAGINTISTMIYQEARRGFNPEMYALSTLLFLIILVILYVINRMSVRQEVEA